MTRRPLRQRPFNGSLTEQIFLIGFNIVSTGTQLPCCPCWHYNSQSQIMLQSICYHCLSCPRGRGWAGTLPVTAGGHWGIWTWTGLGWESNRQPSCSCLFGCSFHIVNMFGLQCRSKSSLSVGKYLVCRPSVQRQIHKVAELGWEFELVGKQYEICGFQFAPFAIIW